MKTLDPKKDRFISASKMKLFDTCQYCFHLRYNVGIPTQDKEYFKVGRDVEDKLKEVLIGAQPCRDVWEDKLAEAIYSNNRFQELIRGQEILFQNKVEGEVAGVPVLGYTDIETTSMVIDIKTSASKWNMAMIQDQKYQPPLYHILTQKEFAFVVAKKAKNPTVEDVQVIRVKISPSSIKNFEEKVKLVWDAWNNDLLSRVHTGGRLCLFPTIKDL